VLGLVELQRLGERLEHALGCPREAAALHPHVVVDRHPGQHRDLLAAQALDAAVAAVRRQAGLLRSDPRAAGAEEVADLVA
jgi:hypothetical protein